MEMPNSVNIAKCAKYNEIEMPDLRIASKCYRVKRNLLALFTRCYGNTEAEITECYEMIYEHIPSPKFRNILIHFVVRYLHFARFRYSRSSEYDNLPSSFDRG